MSQLYYRTMFALLGSVPALFFPRLITRVMPEHDPMADARPASRRYQKAQISGLLKCI